MREREWLHANDMAVVETGMDRNEGPPPPRMSLWMVACSIFY